MLLVAPVQRLLSVAAEDDVKPLLLQKILQALSEKQVVFEQQNASGIGHLDYSTPSIDQPIVWPAYIGTTLPYFSGTLKGVSTRVTSLNSGQMP